MEKGTVFALGFFDGVHLGHQALLTRCRSLAASLGCQAGVVTFLGHPDTLVTGQTPPLINTPADRRRLLAYFGAEKILELPFDRELMEMPWQDFFRKLLEMGAAGLVCGSDFRFGHRGEGNAERLRAASEEAGIPCAVVPQQSLDGIRISSTYIRRLLEEGNMETANRFLGHPHLLTGTVISGRKLGRTLGIPTANLAIPEGCVVPAFGVYACRAWLDGQTHLAVTNVGTRPTVGGHRVTVEPWLLDFQGDLYGRELALEFYAFLRPERKFPSTEELSREIRENAAQTRKFFEKT